jgi:hypothetical protein
MSRAPVNAGPEVVRTTTPESAAEESSQMPGVHRLIPPTIREQVSAAESASQLTSSKRSSQPAEPAHVTMRYANSLLEDSRFEEALQAFLELSHTR